MDLLIVGEAEDKLAQSIVDYFTALNKNVAILDVLSASQLFTLEIINGKVSVSPDLPMIIRTVSPPLMRKNFDDTFQYEEALSTLWAVATASQAPMLNRPTPRNMWGEIAGSSVLTQVRADLIPDTQEIFTCHQKQSFSSVSEQQWYVQYLGTYESAVAGEVLSGSGPYRYRSILAGAEVKYREDAAYPGFHIWLSNAIPTLSVASMHFDLQYQYLTWNKSENIDFSQSLSFTLPIQLPASGGGLNVCDINYMEYLDIRQHNQLDWDLIPRFRSQNYHPYKVGEMVMHSGHTMHQIAPTSTVQQSDARVTLQGHGVCVDGVWWIYW